MLQPANVEHTPQANQNGLGGIVAQSFARRRNSFHDRSHPKSVLQTDLIADIPLFADERLYLFGEDGDLFAHTGVRWQSFTNGVSTADLTGGATPILDIVLDPEARAAAERGSSD